MSHSQKTTCHCLTCDAEGRLLPNGQPQGRTFRLPRHYKAHVLHISREDSDRGVVAPPQSVGIEEASSTMFTATLLDDGPDLDALPSKLWTSRATFQNERAPHISPTVQTDPSSPVSIDTVISGIRRMMISSNAPPSGTNTDDVADQFSALTLADDAHLSSTSVVTGHGHPETSKKDHSQHTVNTLAILRSVHHELQHCSEALSTMSPTSETLKCTRETLAQARRSIQKIRRSTADITALKQQVVEQINTIAGRLIELDSLSSQVGPIDYSMGKLIIATRCCTTLILSFSAALHNIHSSL